MGVNPRRKNYGRVDRRALITEHAVGDSLGCTLKAATWATAPGVSDGLVPALYPVTVGADGIAAPFVVGDQATKPFSGFIIDPVDTTKGDGSVGYIWHGTIDASLLPVAFAPAGVTSGNISKFVFGKA
ncbi:hypothetical protein [Kocuria rosea]|uniref:hypothetical protein n=1 Tax=Kocuria rosea TaxID=1275 RepID=UPI003D341B7A